MSDDEIKRFMQRVSWFGRADEKTTPLVESPMYERFTDRARKVLQLANQECDRFQHEYVGTEHILLGLLKEGSGVAANVLKNLDIDLHKCREEVERCVVPMDEGAKPSGLTPLAKKPLTPRGKQALSYAVDFAKNLNHNYVGTEHILLGVLQVTEGVACQVLTNLKLTVDTVRQARLDLLGHPKEPEEREAIESALMAKWKTTVAVKDDSRLKMAEIERIVNFETDPVKGFTEIKKLFGK